MDALSWPPGGPLATVRSSVEVAPVAAQTKVYVRLARLPAPASCPAPAAGAARGTGLQSRTGLALLAALARDCRLPPFALLHRDGNGKPRFPDGPDFSISHSRGFAACAVAPPGFSIGIDLEPRDRARAAAVLRIAGEQERAALADGVMTATELWTAKEAVLKAAGAGLPEICGVSVQPAIAHFAGRTYAWRHVHPGQGLVLAIVVDRTMPPVEIRWQAPAVDFPLPNPAWEH